MALVKCKECGEQVSTKAQSCPKCGAKAPKRTSLVTWLVLIVVIVGGWGALFSDGTTSSSSSYRPTAAASTATAATTTTPTPAPAQPATPQPAWKYQVDKDQLTGKETGYLVAYSRNALDGWLNDGKAVMGYTCGQGFYVRANDVGFATDDINCSQYSCTHDHYARVRFDDGSTKDVRFDVWDDNNDGMSLIKQSRGENMEAFFINSMKAGHTMYLELETFGTDGKEQIAEFDLTGFTGAFNSCP